MPRRKRSRSSKTDGKRAPSLFEELMWHRVLEGLHHMRADDLSLTQAAREAGTTPRTMKKHLGGAIMKAESGRYEPKPTDRLPRRLRFLTPEGTIAIKTRSYRVAETIGRYWNAVDEFLKTGRTDVLRDFHGKAVRVGSRSYDFVTDPNTLRQLAMAGEVRFEDLYVLTSG